MYLKNIIISICIGLLCTIIVLYTNKYLATLLLIGVSILSIYTMEIKINILLILYTIGITLFVFLWKCLGLIEFPNHNNTYIPYWLPFIVFIIICCVVGLKMKYIY
jgi:hypothetical protein